MPGYNEAAVADRQAKVLYRAEEAAHLMSVSRTAIFNLIRSGDLRALKIGGRRRIPRSSIDDYIDRQLAADSAEAETGGNARGTGTGQAQ